MQSHMSHRRWLTALAAGVIVVAASGGGSAQQASRPATNAAFDQLIDRYLKDVRGIGAQAAPNDMSASSIAAELDTRRRLLKDLEAFDRRTLNFDEDIDWRFLQSILRRHHRG